MNHTVPLDPAANAPITATRQTYEALRSEDRGWQVVELRYGAPSSGPRTLVINKHGRAWVRFESSDKSLSTFRDLEPHQIDSALKEIRAAERLKADFDSKHPELGPFKLLDIAQFARRRIDDARIQMRHTLGTWFSESLQIEAALRERELVVSYDPRSVPPTGVLKRLPDRQIVGPEEAVSPDVRALSRRWVELTDAMTSALTDPQTATERFDALQDRSTGVWSDARLPETLRESLQPLYERVMSPELKREEYQDLVRAIDARVTDDVVYQLAQEQDCSLLVARGDLEAEAVAEITGSPVDYRADWRSDFEEAADRQELAQRLVSTTYYANETIIGVADPIAPEVQVLVNWSGKGSPSSISNAPGIDLQPEEPEEDVQLQGP